MKTRILILTTAVALSALFLSSCGLLKKGPTRGEAYAQIYSEAPISILVMPPINETNKVDAKEAVYATLYRPLVDRGYYVFSPLLSQELLQSESADDAERFIDGTLKPFYQVYHADAVLFTIIKKWQKAPLLNNINVEMEYILRSGKTDEELFRKDVKVTVDCSVVNGGGFLGMLANVVSTALTEHVVGARKANNYVLSDLPNGTYTGKRGADSTEIALPAEIRTISSR